MFIREDKVLTDDGTALYTLTVTPEEHGRYPVVFTRTPYDDAGAEPAAFRSEYEPYIRAGYAWVHQHTRGTGRSEGIMVPFENERADGLKTLAWIERQPFFMGEIYLYGGSYCSFVHLSYLDACPKSVKGAILLVMTPDLYRGMSSNGVLKQDVMIPWYASVYHKNQTDPQAFMKIYPGVTLKRPLRKALAGFFDNGCPEGEALLRSDGTEAAWRRPDGPGDAVNALKTLRFPVLLIESWYDIFLGGAQSMWHDLPDGIRRRSAFLIGPWGHSCQVDPSWDLPVENGEQPDGLNVNWFDHLRTGEPLRHIGEGKVTFFTLGGGWRDAPDLPRGGKADTWYPRADGTLTREPAPAGRRSWRHDPEDPVRFTGGANGFCTVLSGIRAQREPDFCDGVVSFVSAPLTEGMTVSGGIDMDLTAVSDCEDTMIFARLLVERDGKYLPVQEGVCTIGRQDPDYVPGTPARVTMTTDPLSWRFFPGDRLRIDVASANWPTYPSHGNVKGPVTEQTETRVAHNALITGPSRVTLHAE